MLVCDCNDVQYEDILIAVKEYGDDIDAIQNETDAGTVCQCCLEDDCDRVELPLKQAIKKALAECS